MLVICSPNLHGKNWFNFHWIFNSGTNLEKYLNGNYRPNDVAPQPTRQEAGVAKSRADTLNFLRKAQNNGERVERGGVRGIAGRVDRTLPEPDFD
jgi:hypothetical protein